MDYSDSDDLRTFSFRDPFLGSVLIHSLYFFGVHSDFVEQDQNALKCSFSLPPLIHIVLCYRRDSDTLVHRKVYE